MSSPIVGPIPPFSNPPINPQYYQPSQFFISAISLGVQTTITTTANTNYVIGQLVRLLIPNGYGSRELNHRTGYVIAIPAANKVTLNLNSLNASPFIPTPNIHLSTLPQILAIGDVNTGSINASGRSPTQTLIPGSFINISPL